MISGAKIAIRISRIKKIADAVATRSARKRRQKSCRGDRAVTSAGTSSAASKEASGFVRSSEVPVLMV